MDKFRQSKKIGGKEFEDIFGKVYKYDNPSSGEHSFIKRVRIMQDVPHSVLRTISLLSDINHENIVRLWDVFIDDEHDTIYLEFEYFEKHLGQFVQGNHPNYLHLVKKFLYQILCGVSYYHSHGIAHQQLRPENILLDLDREQVKIADLKLVKITERPKGRKETRNCYRAPETLLALPDDNIATDIWSVGCLFAEMVARRPLFSGGNDSECTYQIFSLLGTPNGSWPSAVDLCRDISNLRELKPKELGKQPGFESLEQAGVDLLSKMLCLDPSVRITADKALKHDYFINVRTDVHAAE